jgi:hypothetical protein
VPSSADEVVDYFLFYQGDAMETKRITSFAEFWPYYIDQHQDARCRGLHYIGSTLATVLLLTGLWQGHTAYCLAAIPLGYGPAWVGHFFIEKNRPATLQYPFYSLLADFTMLFRFVTGTLQPHLRPKV